MKKGKEKPKQGQNRAMASGLSRREFIVGTTAGFVTLSLGDLLFPSPVKAATPKKGGKLVYAGSYKNSKHKSAKNAKHPYNGIEIRTKNTYNQLTWVDENLNVVPEVATAWEANDGQDVWEVTIREDIQFHDGRPLTVEDVVASYNLHKDAKLGTSFAKKMVDKVEKIGPNKVRFHLKSPDSEFACNMAEYRQAIMPAGPLDEMGLSGIGSGPIKSAKVDVGRRVIYEANENYWGEGPYLVSTWKRESGDVTLLKSTTYMNESGEAIAQLPGFDPARLIVICDDLSLPLGMLRIRRQGGSGGHLGLESVIMSIQTEAFARLRLGIGSPPPAIDWSEFVLMPFLLEERSDVDRMLASAADALEMVIAEGMDKAMQAYNRKASE